MNFGRFFCYVLLGGALAACASTPPSYYTLLSASQAEVGSALPPVSSKYAISVQTVQLPEQVDRLQIVLADPSSTQVIPLSSALWAAPLSDEIRNALASDLSYKLGVMDVANGMVSASLPLWKIAVRVQRFESIYDRRVTLDASWRLTPVNQPGKKTRLCSAVAQVPVQSGMSALVAGHQEALRGMASLIAAQLAGSQVQVAGVLDKGCVS
ncbi:membrane integrity-associated transporter subunit PqiC [Alcaligenaceae bacterium]|nr:membrane integrity-associated transporter subunit PqiC [Alcaligenaceae bacterium]